MTKIVLVTGGSRGLGRNTAVHLAKTGSDVVLTFHSNETEAAKVVDEIRAMGRKAQAIRLDVSQSKTFAAFADRLKVVLREVWGRENLDVLVNNAGTGGATPSKFS